MIAQLPPLLASCPQKLCPHHNVCLQAGRCVIPGLCDVVFQTPQLSLLWRSVACLCRLGDVVSLVCEMAEGGLRPDAFTFTAILNACQRADEAELALDVAR